MAHIEFSNEAAFEETDLSLSLLEMSLKRGIPHIHACGGNARCSTCRVILLQGLENVLPRNSAEQLLAEKKGLEPDIRLACQTRVTGDVVCRRLVLDRLDADLILSQSSTTSGREANLAILFSDIRDFTPFSSRQLPYDIVHILNRYFAEMGETILRHNGRIDKYLGDGIMALFGLSDPSGRIACLQAVRAAQEMLYRIQNVNAYLKDRFQVELRFGVGIHYGTVLVGDMGHPKHTQFTAVGDAVNIASRVESFTKEAKTPFLISETVYRQIHDSVAVRRTFTARLKGMDEEMTLYAVRLPGGDTVDLKADVQGAGRLEYVLSQTIARFQGPVFLRLAFRDAFGYDLKTRTGGANGSVRLPDEAERTECRGLEPALEALCRVHETLPKFSWADLIAWAGAVAVAKADGPLIRPALGRRDSDLPCPPGPSMNAMTIQELKAHFAALGLTAQDLVALSGAHTLGRAHGKPFTDDLFTFSNSYFQVLLSDREEDKAGLLPTDRMLIDDHECFAYVQRYADNQELFFKDFAFSYRKMTVIGTDLDP